MLSYQHSYHAGCFADVIKHLTLCRLLTYLIKKEKSLLYLETHAGRGVYDLHQQQSLKTKEFNQGVTLIWEKREKLHPLFSPYLLTLNQLNLNSSLRFYPGSPYFALRNLRTFDRLVFNELHPEEFRYLQKLPTQGKRVFYKNEEGMNSLCALLPPLERRGLIFIDPSYEIKKEYETVPKAIQTSYQRFSTGMYCLWYPVLTHRLHRLLAKHLKKINASLLNLEFSLDSSHKVGMQGCGLWIINPPYTLYDEMTILLKSLCDIFNPGQSHYHIEYEP